MARFGRRQHFKPKLGRFDNYLAFIAGQATAGDVASNDCNDDVDNLADIGVTWALNYKGELNTLAYLCSSQNIYAAACVQATLNGFYRAPIPLGAYKGSSIAANGNLDNYAQTLRDGFQPTATRADYIDGVTLLRRVLTSGVPRNSVKLLEGGFLSLIADFLRSPGDSISPLSGSDLAALYVKEFIFTGCYFDGTPEPYNVQFSPNDADYVFTHWPKTVPLTVCPLNLGDLVVSGPPTGASTSFPYGNPIRYGFANNGGGPLTTRFAWHQLALLYAARGLSTFFTYALQNGTITVNTGTFVTTFSTTSNSNHRVLGFNGSPATALGNIFTFWLAMAPAVIRTASTIFPERSNV